MSSDKQDSKNSKVRKRIQQRLSQLTSDRSSFIEDWRDIRDYTWGSRGRYLENQTSKQKYPRRNDRLYNHEAKQSAGVLASGMMAGITSPSRPWFKLQTPDDEMMEFGSVKQWLEDVEKIMMGIFSKSNFYSAMHSFYLELGIFGVSPMGIYEDRQNMAKKAGNLIYFENYTCGNYFLDIGEQRIVDTMYREYAVSVETAAKTWGLDKLSEEAQRMYKNNGKNGSISVIHAIEPRFDRDFMSPLSSEMPYASVYIENTASNWQEPLQVSGFTSKPFVAGRWEVIGEDVYPSSYPGLNALSTNKTLQMLEIDKSTAIEKQHNPPLVGDASLATSGVDLVAGGVTYIPGMAQAGKPGLSPVYNTNPNISHLIEDINKKEQTIQRYFFADLFLMLTEIDRSQITATEIAERKEEKLLMLGPVLERLNSDVLDPIIDRVFDIAQNHGVLPPPPPELDGVDLEVEYISILAQAQKAISTASIESTARFAGELSGIWPEARHKFDAMQAIDEYAKAKGAPQRIVRTDDAAAAEADAEAQAMMAQQAHESAASMADTAKTTSETKLDQDSVLDALLGGMQ